MERKQNLVSYAIFILAYLTMVVGLVLGLFFGTSPNFYILGPLQAVIGWLVFLIGIISGIILLGFSEVIKLLQGILNQQQRFISHKIPESIQSKESIPAPEEIREEIINYFQDRHITEVYKTEEEDYFKIIIDNQPHIVELGSFHPVIILDKKAKELGLLTD